MPSDHTDDRQVDKSDEDVEDSEFSRFESFARRLVRVPKREIDAERAKSNGSDLKP